MLLQMWMQSRIEPIPKLQCITVPFSIRVERWEEAVRARQQSKLYFLKG